MRLSRFQPRGLLLSPPAQPRAGNPGEIQQEAEQRPCPHLPRHYPAVPAGHTSGTQDILQGRGRGKLWGFALVFAVLFAVCVGLK